MTTSKETKLSLKDKLYEETLDEFARKQWNPESLKNDFKNWKEMTEIYPKKDRGWLIYQADIEKAVKLAIQKTYNALQASKLTEVGQSLYDRRKDIEAHTAKKIFAELDNLHIVENWSNQKGKGIPLLLKQIDTYDAVKKKYKVD